MPWTRVLLGESDIQRFSAEGLRCITYAEALREAQQQAMAADPRVFIMGEGVDDPGGIFGSTRGLAQEFGERVMDLPIAENGMTGVAIGAAAAGMRPIFVHMRTDFLPMAMDQLVNHAAKWHYMSGGQVRVPLVVRSIIGRGWGSAAQHSQGLHSLFLSVPGLKLAMPATAYDAKGLLLAALADENPVLLFEHRWIYGSVGVVPEEPYTVPLGQAVVRREGTDVTVVALSHMVYEAAKAADALQGRGISVEIVDPRCLRPLDMDTIAASVARTGRLVIADVACRTAGLGAEIACRLAERNPGLLKAPLRRISFPDAPTPASPVLEAAYYPGSEQIAQAILELTEGPA